MKGRLQFLGESTVHIVSIMVFYSFFGIAWQVFLFHTLPVDKAVCPFLVKHLDIQVWHPNDDKTLGTLLEAQVDM